MDDPWRLFGRIKTLWFCHLLQVLPTCIELKAQSGECQKAHKHKRARWKIELIFNFVESDPKYNLHDITRHLVYSIDVIFWRVICAYGTCTAGLVIFVFHSGKLNKIYQPHVCGIVGSVAADWITGHRVIFRWNTAFDYTRLNGTEIGKLWQVPLFVQEK